MTIKTHKLKITPKFYQPVVDGVKNFEIRFNDRNFQVGDVLILREWDASRKRYTGEQIKRTVTYITDFNQPKGWVVMGIKK